MVRAGPWVPRDGNAVATVRVDKTSMWGVEIGVMGEDYTDWDGTMWDSPHTWYYHPSPSGSTEMAIVHDSRFICEQSRVFPVLTVGSEITVTLTGGTVTFTHDGTDVYSFELPENCGRISLAVCVWEDGQVTLL